MKFDTVIVGGGTAGSILAGRLTEDPSHTVCLIEAGALYRSIGELPVAVRTHRSLRPLQTTVRDNPNDPALVGFPDWGYRARSTALQPDVIVPRGKVVGGSSSVNGAVYLRAVREDLDEWATAGNTEWSYEKCLESFLRIENDHDFGDREYHNDSGPIHINRASVHDWVPLNAAFFESCIDYGFQDCPDLNAPDSWGVGPNPVNMHERLRYSTAVGYLMPALGRSNLTILGDALATRLVMNGVKAEGVEVEINQRSMTVEGQEILLTAGAVGSPQLLMLSGIGPADHLKSLGITPIIDLPGVGQNLRDHPVARCSWAALEDVQPPTGLPGLPGQLAVRATVPGSTDVHDMRLISFGVEGADRFGLIYSLMRAASVGEMHLISADATVAPAIDFRHLDDPSDRSRMRSMLEVVMELAEHPAYRRLRGRRLRPHDAEIATSAAFNEWMLGEVFTSHHISCTCKMGPASDATAVVDQLCRVHGVENLRVVDASIMVDCPRVNPNATTMMIAERFSDLYRGR